MSIARNVAGSVDTIVFFDLTTGAPATTGTPTGFRCIDGGTQAPLTGTFVHEGNGQWSYRRSAEDTDGERVNGIYLLTGCYAVPFVIYTRDAQLRLISGMVPDTAGSDIEGTVMASPTPTTKTFRLTGLPTPLVAFGGQFVQFLDGKLKGLALPLAAYSSVSSTSGDVTIIGSMPSAPAAGVRVRLGGYRG